MPALTTAAQPIADKSGSHALRAESDRLLRLSGRINTMRPALICFCPKGSASAEGVGVGLPTICLAAVARSDNRVHQPHLMRRFHCRCAPDRRQVRLLRPPGRIRLSVQSGTRSVRNRSSHKPAESETALWSRPIRLLILAAGRGSWLADDLARSGSKIRQPSTSDPAYCAGFTAAARQIADKSGSYALDCPPKVGQFQLLASAAWVLYVTGLSPFSFSLIRSWL